MSTFEIRVPIPPEGVLGLMAKISSVMHDIVEAGRTEIVKLASQQLGSSGQEYIDGLSPVMYSLPAGAPLPLAEVEYATIVLNGWLPNAVENGWPGGDMKAALLGGASAKPTKDGGRIAFIPFRHMTPGTSGRSGAAMGSADQASFSLGSGGVAQAGSATRSQSQAIGRAVHKAAKQLEGTTSSPGGGTSWGGRLPAGVGGAVPLKAHHKGDIYAGMVRKEKTYTKSTQSSYMTFRAVSTNSDPAAWQHPGIEPRHLFNEGQRALEDAARYLIGIAVGG